MKRSRSAGFLLRLWNVCASVATRRVAVLVSLGVLLAVVAFLGFSDFTEPARAQDNVRPAAGFANVYQVFSRENPFSDEWLAANHGFYDNEWTAEYETRLQRAAGLTEVKLADMLLPDYGSDVRQSNGSVIGSNQNEFQIAVNPTNRLNAIGTSNDSLTAGVGIFRTTDGGATWTSADASAYGVQASCCDPGVAFGSDGKAYVVILDTSPAATYILRSTDSGATWNGPSSVSTPDRENIAVDPTNSNNVLITYSDLPATNRIKGYKSTDGGVTWGSSFFIGDTAPAAGYEQSSQPLIAGNGTRYYVGYQQYTNSGSGCSAGVQNVVARSTDAGATWAWATLPIVQGGACVAAQAGRGVFCINGAGGVFRSRSHPIMGVSPTNPTHVYMTYSGGDLEPNGGYTCGGGTGNHSDTLFRRSTDGGVTWTAPAKVNSDADGANKDQYYPWMSVLPNGQIWVGWNDRRDDANDFLSKWYQAHSTDEGATWLNAAGSPGNDVVSDVQTQPSTFIGDYHGLGAGGNGAGNVLGMWFDSRNNASGDAYTDPQTPGGSTCVPGYSRTTMTGQSIVAGTADVGNHCDDCNTAVALPFAFPFYGTPVNSVNVDSNGNMGFTAADDTFTNTCLPDPAANNGIFPHWDDQCTGVCGTSTCTGCGIFTSVTGSAPSRIFNIEYRTNYYNTNTTLNYEVRLYETSGQIDVVYGALNGTGSSATIGLQKDVGSVFDEFECNTGGLSTGLKITYTPTTCGTTPFDFDGDHKSDISVWRPGPGQWWLNRSTAGVIGIQFGSSTDVPRAADYTGDGKTDVAFFRPSTNEWYIIRSENFTYYAFPFGAAGDISTTGDFDGDGKADAAVYRPSQQTWYILRSSNQSLLSIPFGLSTDIPVPADYDGDGKTDAAVYRANLGQWWILRSSNNTALGVAFGTSTDKPVPGDYTGDGKADIAFYRPSTSEWYIVRSENLTYYAFPWGASGDKPAPGDFDGDGKFDAAVYRPSDTRWYIFLSGGGTINVPFGISSDVPVPGQLVP